MPQAHQEKRGYLSEDKYPRDALVLRWIEKLIGLRHPEPNRYRPSDSKVENLVV